MLPLLVLFFSFALLLVLIALPVASHRFILPPATSPLTPAARPQTLLSIPSHRRFENPTRSHRRCAYPAPVLCDQHDHPPYDSPAPYTGAARPTRPYPPTHTRSFAAPVRLS
ncbi:hypothetical protein PLICRDRAFT_43243 [Plicaturopsis crispa FD-325 SS-3]|nr:hypothetical protein PLICRDRAFT_43243 [Plicaturopsis crispa FD-325 SS-3]